MIRTKFPSRNFPIQTTFERIIHSSCDSRNLNLSPFCDLTSPSLTMWRPSVVETYEDQTTDYVNKIVSPLRPKYPNAMDEREIIKSLTKVGQVVKDHLVIFLRGGEQHYDAYEKDIAIVNLFFGEPTVYGEMN